MEGPPAPGAAGEPPLKAPRVEPFEPEQHAFVPPGEAARGQPPRREKARKNGLGLYVERQRSERGSKLDFGLLFKEFWALPPAEQDTYREAAVRDAGPQIWVGPLPPRVEA